MLLTVGIESRFNIYSLAVYAQSRKIPQFVYSTYVIQTINVNDIDFKINLYGISYFTSERVRDASPYRTSLYMK